MTYELYLAPGQDSDSGLTADKIYRHLKKAGLSKRAVGYGLGEPEIWRWLHNPSEYPEELRSTGIVLWGNGSMVGVAYTNNLTGKVTCSDYYEVAALIWHEEKLVVEWIKHYDILRYPALLRKD